MSAARPQPRRVVAAAERAGAADLQQERPVAGELQDLPVAVGVAADPDVVHVVDEEAVLPVGPLVAVTGTAPGLDDVAFLVELDHRRRGDAALRGRRVGRGAALALGQRPRPVQHPDVVARVDRHADDVTEQPLVGKRLRPEWIHLQLLSRHGVLGHEGAVERAVPKAERDTARDEGRRHPRLMFPLHRYLPGSNRGSPWKDARFRLGLLYTGRPARALEHRSPTPAQEASRCNRFPIPRASPKPTSPASRWTTKTCRGAQPRRCRRAVPLNAPQQGGSLCRCR